MTPPPTTKTTRARSVEIAQIDCTGFGVLIREKLVQEGDETIVVSREVYRCNDVDHEQAQAAAVPAG